MGFREQLSNLVTKATSQLSNYASSARNTISSFLGRPKQAPTKAAIPVKTKSTTQVLREEQVKQRRGLDKFTSQVYTKEQLADRVQARREAELTPEQIDAIARRAGYVKPEEVQRAQYTRERKLKSGLYKPSDEVVIYEGQEAPPEEEEVPTPAEPERKKSYRYQGVVTYSIEYKETGETHFDNKVTADRATLEEARAEVNSVVENIRLNSRAVTIESIVIIEYTTDGEERVAEQIAVSRE